MLGTVNEANSALSCVSRQPQMETNCRLLRAEWKALLSQEIWSGEKLTRSYVVGKRDRVTTYAVRSDLRDRMDQKHRSHD